MSQTPTDHTTLKYTLNTTSAPRTHSTHSSLESLPTATSLPSSSSTATIVYIVTDIRYPTTADFDANKGIFSIDSVHSSPRNANARAKKIIYDGGQVDGGQFKVDVDKIIEEMRRGLFTGIGIGGKGDGRVGSCYARKCQVEGKLVDEDSEDEGDGEEERVREDEKMEEEGDVEMG